MNTKILSNNHLLAALLIGVALFISGVLIAQASSPFDIEFPIPELGSCATQTECKAYCDNSAHEDACRAFAESHGLGSSADDRDDDERFTEALKDGGPGGCALQGGDPLRACETFCNQAANMRQCVAYAKTHNLMDARDLEEAEKVIRALDSGVPLPAACSDAHSCKEVCEEPKDITTMRQCFAFAESAGLLPPGVDHEQAEKMFRAIEEGRAPFKSPKDFKQCEDPQNDEIFEKCLAFALESGFIPQEEVEMIRKTGGKGPGGCRGREQCETFCSQEANREACFAFAEEHDLISPEDRRRMEEGKREASRVLESAPPEVLSCIASAIGADKLEKVKRGEGFIGPELGNIIPRCFNQVLGGEEHGGPFGRGVPPQALNCMRQIFGDDFEARLRAGELDPGLHDEEIRACMKRELGEGYLNDHGEYERPQPSGEGGDFPEFRGEGEHREGLPPRPQEEGGYPSEYPRQSEFGDYPHPDGAFPPAPPSPEEYEKYRQEYEARYQEQFDGQYNEEYQQQYDQYQQQYQDGFDGTTPPDGYQQYDSAPPPGDGQNYTPPSTFVPLTTRTQLASAIGAVLNWLFGR